MNRTDITMLLNRRRAMWDIPRPDADTLNEWARVLGNFTLNETCDALDRLLETETRPPSPARLITEIRNRQPHRSDPAPLGNADCELCEGIGLTVIITPGDGALAATRYGACPRCQPNRAQRRPEPTNPPTTFASMDPAAVDARRAWFRAGAVGHWPGCPCGSCHTIA